MGYGRGIFLCFLTELRSMIRQHVLYSVSVQAVGGCIIDVKNKKQYLNKAQFAELQLIAICKLK